MKRIISFFLVLCLMMSTMCVFTSATDESPAPVYDQTELSAKDFLVKLGALDENIDLNGYATKSSFLCMVLDATKVITVDAEKQYFADVPMNYYAANEIATGYNVGYIRGNGNGTFSPDKIINVNEAVAIAMNALNYGYMAGSSEYYNIIKKQNILKDVETKADGSLDNGACIVLLKNMLMAEYNMLTGVIGDKDIYTRDGGTTLLYLHYSIIVSKNIVTATQNIYLNGHDKTNLGYMRLDDVLVEDKEGLANDLLGFRVEAFVKETENGYELFSVEKTQHNEELIIEAEDLTTKSTATKVVYKETNRKEETIELPKNYTLIYNGRNYNGFTNSVFHIDQGKIRLVSNNSNEYTLVYVYEYENKIIKKVNTQDKKVYFEGETLPVDFSKKDKILQNAKGKTITCDELYEGLVLTVFAAKSSVATYQAGKGDFIMVPDSIDEDYIYMGEEKIPMTKDLKKKSNTVKLGQKTIFMLDAFGDAVDFKLVSSGAMYGYLVAFEVTHSRAQKVLFDVKIFTENNKMEVFSTDKEIRFGGKKQDSAVVLAKFSEKSESNPEKLACVPQLIKFSVTEDGTLKEMWKAVDNYDKDNKNWKGYSEDFSMDYDMGQVGKVYYRESSCAFNTKFIANGQTIRFIIPSSGEDKDYKCIPCSGALVKAGGVDNCNFKLYDIGKNRIASVLLDVGGKEGFAIEYKQPIIISKVSYVANEDGGVQLAIRGYQEGKEVRYIAEDNLVVEAPPEADASKDIWRVSFAGTKITALEVGDVIQVITEGTEGKISDFRILYKRNDSRKYDEGSNGSMNDNEYDGYIYTAAAKIKEQYDEVLVAHTNVGATLGGANENLRAIPIPSSAVFYVYDSVDDELRLTDKSEYMEEYEAFIAISLSSLKLVVIYK